jgi:hypothetical protein
VRTSNARSVALCAALAALIFVSAISLSGRAAAGGDLLRNGTFDAGVRYWSLGTNSDLNTLTFAPNEDAESNPASGAAEVIIGEGPYDPGSSYTETVVQCVPVSGGLEYNLSANVRVPTTEQFADTHADLSLFWYGNPNCAGSFIGSQYAGPVGMSNAWQSLAVTGVSPAYTRSVFVRMELDGQDAAGPDQSYAYFDGARLLGQLGTLPGDANCDREINSIDALLILQITAGLIQALPYLVNGDANEDGIVSAIDATVTLQFGAGLVDRLPST